MKKNRQCIDCKEMIWNNAIRCHSCENKRRHHLGILNSKGENNPFFKERVKVNCSYCNEILEKNPYRIIITKNFFCNEEHFYLWKKEHIKGINNPNWKDGSSIGEYGEDFDNDLREHIRFRDNYKCQICGCSQLENGKQLDVHHIDYDKKNCKTNNLISLCRICHMKTNGHRKYWINYFSTKKEEIHGTIS